MEGHIYLPRRAEEGRTAYIQNVPTRYYLDDQPVIRSQFNRMTKRSSWPGLGLDWLQAALGEVERVFESLTSSLTSSYCPCRLELFAGRQWEDQK